MSAAHWPIVSVCIASYNHAHYLPAALDSILSQTLQDFEVVVVDDGSSDQSLLILQDYAARDRRIRVFTHPGHSNRGIAASWNLAFEQSTGQFLTWIGSDDAIYPENLEH